jgi:hypothetical protein
MRPAGEVRQALLTAATRLATPEKAPTLREIAECACVGYDAARRTIDNMTRSGQLRVAGERRVEYRNRPVAEYRPGGWSAGADGAGSMALSHLMAAWKP